MAAAEVGVVRKEERMELSRALMKTHELQYFLNTSLRNIDLACKSSLLCLMEKKSQLQHLLIFKELLLRACRETPGNITLGLCAAWAAPSESSKLTARSLGKETQTIPMLQSSIKLESKVSSDCWGRRCGL